MTDSRGFEIDRTQSGRIRVNAVSVANLVALFGLFGLAIGAWSGVTSSVAILTIRSETTERSQLNVNAELRELRMLASGVDKRLAVTEAALTTAVTVINRMETKLNAAAAR